MWASPIAYSILPLHPSPPISRSCAVIIIGHRQLDVGATYLDATEQGYISAAVNAGTGLVNFDNVLDNAGTPRYTYVQTIFNFGYGGTKSGSNVSSPAPPVITLRNNTVPGRRSAPAP